MIRITVEEDSAVTTRSGKSQKGKDYTMHEQTVWVHLLTQDGKPARYPTQGRVNIEDADKPYPRGTYQLDPRSVSVGQYGSIELGRVRLVPIAQGTTKPA